MAIGDKRVNLDVLKAIHDADAANVADLKSALQYSYAIMVADWESGGLSVGTGNGVAGTNRIRTVNALTGITAIIAGNGYAYALYAWSGSTYVGAWNGTAWSHSTTSPWRTGETIIASLENADSYSLKIVLKRTDDADISTSAMENLTIYSCTDKTLEQAYKAADAYVTGKRLSDAEGNLASLMVGFGAGEVTVKNGAEILISGHALNGSGAEISSGSSYCSDFVAARSGYVATSTLTYDAAKIASSWYHYIAFYDSNKEFISRVGGGKQVSVSGDVPQNAAYMRTSLTYINQAALVDYVLTQVATIVNGSPKNKWYVLGDSISAGYYSMTESMAQEAGVALTYQSPVTTEDGEATGSVWDSSLAHNYWGYANKWKLNRNLIGKAYPGQGYFRTASNSQNGVYVVSHNDFSDAGLITVAWGFNDWHYNQARGNHDLIDASVPYPEENYDTTQITTVNQAIWYCLGELIRKAPNAKIVVQTPMNGWAYGGDWSTNWGIGYAMSNSGTLANIHDDIVYWANYYGLQILDMTYNNSIVNRRNIKDTIIDGSHPSDAAHQQLGRHVAQALNYC